jgi:hypothetical protein
VGVPSIGERGVASALQAWVSKEGVGAQGQRKRQRGGALARRPWPPDAGLALSAPLQAARSPPPAHCAAKTRRRRWTWPRHPPSAAHAARAAPGLRAAAPGGQLRASDRSLPPAAESGHRRALFARRARPRGLLVPASRNSPRSSRCAGVLRALIPGNQLTQLSVVLSLQQYNGTTAEIFGRHGFGASLAIHLLSAPPLLTRRHTAGRGVHYQGHAIL